jgi:hypothetical protein
MHVQDVAVYDLELHPAELRDRIVRGSADTEVTGRQPELMPELPTTSAARENLAQFGAVAAICNASTFAADEHEKPLTDRIIIGDATGEQ